MIKRYVLNGDPVAWKRAVPKRRGGAYDSQANLKFYIGSILKLQHRGDRLFEGPIKMDIVFVFEVPKSKKDKLQHNWMVNRPDVSNLVKLIEDAASNDVLYHDDCIIVWSDIKKVYGSPSRTEFTLTELCDNVSTGENQGEQ